MKKDNSIASFWQSYTTAEKAAKLLTGKTESQAPGSIADTVNAEESPDSGMLEVVDYHP